MWASSSITNAVMQAALNQAFFRLVFSGGFATVGDSVAAARAVVTDRDVRRSWIFFGDPAMRLKGVPRATDVLDRLTSTPTSGPVRSAWSRNRAPGRRPRSNARRSPGREWQRRCPLGVVDCRRCTKGRPRCRGAASRAFESVEHGRRQRPVEVVWNDEVTCAQADGALCPQRLLQPPELGDRLVPPRDRHRLALGDV